MDLLGTLGELEAASVALVLRQQAIDTTRPAGRMFFQVTGEFAEFERGMVGTRESARRAAWPTEDGVKSGGRH